MHARLPNNVASASSQEWVEDRPMPCKFTKYQSLRKSEWDDECETKGLIDEIQAPPPPRVAGIEDFVDVTVDQRQAAARSILPLSRQQRRRTWTRQDAETRPSGSSAEVIVYAIRHFNAPDL